MNPISFLERLRSEYIKTESDDLLFTNKACQIEGEVFKLNAWKDFHGADQLVIFELKSNSILAVESTCIGIRYSGKSEHMLLSSEQLWAIGVS